MELMKNESQLLRILLFVVCLGSLANIRYNNKDLLARRIKFSTFTFSTEVKFSNSKRNACYTKK